MDYMQRYGGDPDPGELGQPESEISPIRSANLVEMVYYLVLSRYYACKCRRPLPDIRMFDVSLVPRPGPGRGRGRAAWGERVPIPSLAWSVSRFRRLSAFLER